MKFKLTKGANYLAACSFGATSMALINFLQEQGCKPVVLFVDYHEAPTGKEDLEKLGAYCEEKGLILEVCDTALTPQEEDESYKDWARKVRYGFFKAMYKKYKAKALFVGHIQDDMLETYILQKKSGAKYEIYGYNEINSYQGMIVVRPLLPYSMSDVYDYLREKHVPYSQAMTEFEATKTVSDIRQNIIAKLSEVERGQLVEEINAANDEKLTYFKHVGKEAEVATELSIREIIALDEDEFAEALTIFLSKLEDVTVDTGLIAKIRAMCLNGKLFDSMKLTDNDYLIKEYDVLLLGINPKSLPYSYSIEGPTKLSTKEFDLDFTMGAEDRNIKDNDYPITIRTVLPADQYVYNGYLVFVRSLFAAWEMPHDYRYMWPVFANKDNKIIYVPTYRHDFVEYHKSVLKLHLSGNVDPIEE